MKNISFEEWEYGSVSIGDQVFDPIYDEENKFVQITNQGIVERGILLGFKGRETGIVLGPWFQEVSESID